MASLIVAVCLHCAILKDLYVFNDKKSPQGKRYMQFFLQNLQNVIFKILKMFKNNRNSPEQPVELTR